MELVALGLSVLVVWLGVRGTMYKRAAMRVYEVRDGAREAAELNEQAIAVASALLKQVATLQADVDRTARRAEEAVEAVSQCSGGR